MNNLLIRTISGLVLIVVVAGAILLSEYSMLALVLLIYSFSIYEFKKMYELKKNILFIIILLSGLLFIAANYLRISKTITPVTYLIIIFGILTTIALYHLLFRSASNREIGKLLFGSTWIAGALSFYLALGWMENTSIFQPRLIQLH